MSDMIERPCTSHHHACDCREKQLADRIEALEASVMAKQLAIDAATAQIVLGSKRIRELEAMPPEVERTDLVLVPRELIDAAKNLIAVKGRHHTELAYKQLCQALVNCEWSKP